MRGLPWFRMYTDFLNDPKLIQIAFEDQRHFIGVLALKCDGALDQDCTQDILDRIVAQRLWLDYSTINDVKKRLVSAGLIDSNWQPIAWEKRQFKSDHDATGAERQRRFREKQKENALRNATVTLPDTETYTDTDKNNGAKARFVVPTTADITAYAESKGWQIDADKFWNHYESKGWMVGKNKMKSWKAAVSNSREWTEKKSGIAGRNLSAAEEDKILFPRKAI